MLYAAGNHLFRSTNEGQSWEIISPDLTRADSTKLGPSGGPITKDNTGVEYYATIFSVAESPYDPKILWMGSDDGLVHLTRDGGASWVDITPDGMPEWMQINDLIAHPTQEGSAYFAGTRYKLDDFSPYIYKTTNYGMDWELIVNGIDNHHFTRAIQPIIRMQGFYGLARSLGCVYRLMTARIGRYFSRIYPLSPSQIWIGKIMT